MLNERNIPLEEDGIEEEILVDEEVAITKAMWGDIGGNIENQTDLQNALDAKQDSLTESQLNAVNSGITAVKVTTYDGYADQIASKADQSALNAETIARGQADTALGTRIDNEALARQSADNGLQTQIDAITSKSDVVDVVANYATLQAYDTSTLGNNDVVKVLDDETHEDALTYYRWSTTTQTWSYIGQEAPYYSKGQMDVMLQGKQDTLTAGANVQIENGTISATDTTYTAGNGLNLNGTEFSADTDVLATKEDLEGYYTKPEADNLLAPKLEAEVVAELPTTGAEGKLYLTPKAHTTQTATGNPITATVAEDAGKIESFQLDGDTYQQSYTGKNLYNNEAIPYVAKRAYGRDGAVLSWSDYTGTDEYQPVEPSTEYTLWNDKIGNTTYICEYDENKNFIQRLVAVKTFTTTATTKYLRWSLNVGTGEVAPTRTQLELGSAETSYEPFVGGTPSPNPDYPQQIRTVTGIQTISINGTDYPLNLGNIELNGLGDDGNGNPLYRDYIYPDGDDWKVHKAVAKHALKPNEGWLIPNPARYPNLFQTNAISDLYNLSDAYTTASTSPQAYCEALVYLPGSGDVRTTQGFSLFHTVEGGAEYTIARINIAGFTTTTQLDNWLSTCNANFWYGVKIPTDTVITDQTLISQLEAIRTAALENGANTITNTATGTNLAGDMEIGYYGFNPRNRYDKWLWLDINNEYEQIGS
jgi:hypothetical protein